MPIKTNDIRTVCEIKALIQGLSVNNNGDMATFYNHDKYWKTDNPETTATPEEARKQAISGVCNDGTETNQDGTKNEIQILRAGLIWRPVRREEAVLSLLEKIPATCALKRLRWAKNQFTKYDMTKSITVEDAIKVAEKTASGYRGNHPIGGKTPNLIPLTKLVRKREPDQTIANIIMTILSMADEKKGLPPVYYFYMGGKYWVRISPHPVIWGLMEDIPPMDNLGRFSFRR